MKTPQISVIRQNHLTNYNNNRTEYVIHCNEDAIYDITPAQLLQIYEMMEQFVTEIKKGGKL